MAYRKADLERFYPAVARRAEFRCEYRLAPESFFTHRHSVDHVVPESRGGGTDFGNLALGCYACQQRKAVFTEAVDPQTGRRVRLFNPRRQRWARNFRWSADGLRIVGLTSRGRATVGRLGLNDSRQVEARKRWRRYPDLFP